MVGVEMLGLNPDNGSHFDAIFVLLVGPLVLVLYLWHRWRVKRDKRRAREERRHEFKALVRDTPPLSSFKVPPGEVYDQGPHGSSVGYASAHELAAELARERGFDADQ